MTRTDPLIVKPAATTLVALSAGMHNIQQILVIATIGAIVAVLKKLDIDEWKNDRANVLLDMPANFAASFGMTFIVYYGGTDGINKYYMDIGQVVWLFIAFTTALYADPILRTVGSAVKRYINKGDKK